MNLSPDLNPHLGLCDNFTSRELEILYMILDEKSNKQIADILCISIRTVEVHRKNLLEKLNVKTTVGLVKVIYEMRLKAMHLTERLIE